uniref:Histone-lysine N-methyltransferase ATX2 n=1 Tax=Kalanchoe fedtschenkoi TaxID=63787 RepID=A0A7N0ZX34_KALFE
MVFPRAKVLNPHNLCDDGEPPNKFNPRDANIPTTAAATTTPISDTPINYLPLQRVYSASTLSGPGRHRGQPDLKFYTRRTDGKRVCYWDRMCARLELEKDQMVDAKAMSGFTKRKIDFSQVHKVGHHGDLSNGIQLRQCRTGGGFSLQKKRKRLDISDKVFSGQTSIKRWVGLSFEDVDPRAFIGLACKVYWPLDDVWYSGSVMEYNPGTNRHQVKYEDGDAEDLKLSKERIKFHISLVDLQQMNLKISLKNAENSNLDYDELLVLAASLDDCQEVEPGDIIWAKLTGYAMWPAIVVDESCVGNHKGFNKSAGDGTIPVQFFGTHDFARIKTKQLTSFLRGLMLSCHLKCKKPQFLRSLEEAKMYLNEQKLPDEMLKQQVSWHIDLQNGKVKTSKSDEGDLQSSRIGEEGITFPIEIGDLRVVSLGKAVKESGYFKNGKYIWPEGYTAVRKYNSISDPKEYSFYHMEVHRDSQAKQQPLFVVTSDTGETFKGATPSACWKKIYKRIRKLQKNTHGENGSDAGIELCTLGCDMFGFSHPKIFKLIQELATKKVSAKFSKHKLTYKSSRDLPPGYSPVNVAWNDFDKCNVCHMDEEYESNLFLQCDKCRMLVHARCYGEVEPVGEKLWLCKLCRPGAPISPPPCCLCPHKGGAMKPTTDGRWAHLACAMWIPETCLSDVKTMEPIDGLSRVNKDRWKLLCSICGISYGACIQCSNHSCRVAYHPLCARAAGLCVELENEESLHLVSIDENEEDQCIRLLSFLL